MDPTAPMGIAWLAPTSIGFSQGRDTGGPASELSTKVELAVNLKVAKTLGITIPTAILVRADEVIE